MKSKTPYIPSQDKAENIIHRLFVHEKMSPNEIFKHLNKRWQQQEIIRQLAKSTMWHRDGFIIIESSMNFELN